MIERRGIPSVEQRKRQPASVIGLVRDVRDVAWLIRQWIRASDAHSRQASQFSLLEWVQQRLMPDYILGEYAKLWFSDQEFLRRHGDFQPEGLRGAERKFLLASLAAAVAWLPGDTAEAGVYMGTSSWFICDALRGHGKTHYGFDSFQGLSEPDSDRDGGYWALHDLSIPEGIARQRLAQFPARLYKGWIPDCFAQADVDQLCFAHIDVDLYEPTRDAIAFFYPRTVPGGIIVCDDYGFTTCPGATRAIDDFMAQRPEEVIHSPTGQGIILKQGSMA